MNRSSLDLAPQHLLAVATRFTLVALVAVLAVAASGLAGCVPAGQAERGSQRPLNGTEWPTPRATAARSTPTAFPKVGAVRIKVVDDLATPQPSRASTSAGASIDSANATPNSNVGSTDVRTPPAAGISLAAEPLTTLPVVKAIVRGAAGVNLRIGPSTSSQILAVLARGEAVSVLGLSEGARDWAFIRTGTGKSGWAYGDLLDSDGPLSGAPSISASPMAPPPESGPGTAEVLSASGGGPEATETVRPTGSSSTWARGRIVLQLSSGGDVMTIGADGTGLRRLTQGIDPVVSPDGRRVALTRWNGTDGSLWIVPLDGSAERQISGGTKQAKHPTWSPDGTRIAVSYQHGGRLDPARPCVSLSEGSNSPPDIPWNVEKDSVGVEIRGEYPKLAPYLCWTVPPDPHWSVRIVDVASGKTDDQLTDRYAYGPEWDPANPWRIITSGFEGLTQIDVNRAAVWLLTDRRDDRTPAFSPDGRYIAVVSKTGGHYDIHRLDASGGGRVALTSSPLWLVAEKDELRAWNNVAPAWSPDGTRIAFLTDRKGRWEIWVMNADGTGQQPMFGDDINAQLQLRYDFVDERMLSWAA